MMLKHFSLLIFLSMSILCPRVAQPASHQVKVFAAASLKESIDAIALQWKKASGQEVVVSYGGSSSLARQIEQGAPADIFISADVQWMDYLQQRRLVRRDTRVNLVGNQLVLIAPASGSLKNIGLNRPDALLKALGSKGRLAVAETGGVPAGRYAKQSLVTLGLWERVSEKLAQAENVRAAMAFVARAEAPLGIVYATDAKAEPKVRVVAVFPDDSHDPVMYPAAQVISANARASTGFLKFLQSRQARLVFKKSGFKLP